MFVPVGEDITFGEMDPARKKDMSHRSDAFAKFLAGPFKGLSQ
jgi:XTP/dITP diphosphohydrolase